MLDIPAARSTWRSGRGVDRKRKVQIGRAVSSILADVREEGIYEARVNLQGCG